jgi:hypothetical protein
VCLGALAFAAFSIRGYGWEAFFWALGLSLAGVPIYYWLRHRQAGAPAPAPSP